MAFGLLLPLRILQFLVGAIVLGLSAYVAHWYDAETLTDSPTQINFLIFTPIFTFFAILYLELTPRFAKRASHPYVHFAFESFTALFYLAGFIALAVFLSKLLFCRGSVCAAARADAGVAALGWVLWMVTTIMLGLDIFKGGFRAAGEKHVMSSGMRQLP